MAVDLQWEPHGVVRSFSGVVPFQEYMESIAEMQNDMRFDRIRYIVEDYAAVESMEVTAVDLELVIASAIGAAYSNPSIRVAAIPSPSCSRVLIREFVKNSPYVTRLFDSMEEARAWIRGGDTAPVPLDVSLQAAVDFPDRPVVF